MSGLLSLAAAFLAIGSLVLQSTPARAARSGPAAYWKFDESTAGTAAADSSGNSNNLTPIGSPAPSTNIPTAMNNAIADSHSVGFNGSSQYFSVADNSSFDSTGAVSISTWVKFNSLSGNQTIAAKWQVGVAQQWVLQASGNQITWWTGDGANGANNELIGGTVATGTWYHIVATATAGSKNLYINGTLSSSNTSGSMGLASGTPVTVGGKQDSSGTYFEYLNGSVDDMRVYSRVLSSGEASTLASGSESTTLIGGSPVNNEIHATSNVTDLQVATTASNPTVYVKLYVSHGTISLGTATGLTFYDPSGTSLGSTQPTNATILHIGGSLSNVNNALATLHYIRTDSGTGADDLQASLVQPGQVFFSGNGHLYQYVAGPVTWTQAKTAAAASTLYGAQGYLATITSSAENSFIQTQLQSNSWIGASDDTSQGTTEGNWIWTNGPESGDQFWQGNGSGSIVNGMYAHWDNTTTGGTGAEPNNSGGNENCAEFYYSNNGLWNDLSCSNMLGYIIEYGAPGGLPTVSSEDVSITTVDTTPPTAPGAPGASSPTSDATPAVSWSAATDSGSGLASPAYTLQWSSSSTFASVAGSTTATSTSVSPPSNLADGTWYFRVVASDISGNTTNSAISSGIVIDTTAPTTPGMPSTISPTNNAKPVWSWVASNDSGSGLGSPAYSVQWSQSSSFASGVSSATAATTSFTQPANLADGTWYFRVRAADAVGNNSTYTTNGSVLVDTIAPTVPGTPTLSSPTNNNTPTISWTASSDTGSGLASQPYTIEWSHDAGFSGLAGIAGVAGASYTIPSSLALTDGTWYFRVMATDQVGNNSAFSGATNLVVDTVLPVVSNVASSAISDNGTTITWTTDKQASSEIAYGPTNAYGSTTLETNTSPRVTSHSTILSGLVACTLYHFRAVSTDALTNVGLGADATFMTTGCAGSASVIAHSETQITQSSGGTASLGNDVMLQVPANFAGSSADFQIKQIDPTASLQTIGWPNGVSLAGNAVYDIKAMQDTTTAITSFAQPVTVTMHYSQSDIAGLAETSLKIYRWDSGTGWTTLDGCSVDTTAKTVTCTTPGFSTFALFGTVAPQSSTTNGASPPEASQSTIPQAQSTGTIIEPSTQTPAVTQSTSKPTVRFENNASKKSTSSGSWHGWYWLLGIMIIAGFGWLIATKKRKRKKGDS